MSDIQAQGRDQATSRWTRRDLLLIGAAVILLFGAIFALGQRDGLITRFNNLPVAIARFYTADYHALAFKPGDTEVIYFGHHNGVMRTANGGVDWKPVLNQGDAMSLAVLPDSPDTIVAAGHLLLVRSDDQGRTWQFIAHDLPYDDIHGFAVNPADERQWFAFVVGYGLFRTEDQGAHWTAISKGLPDTTMGLVVVPSNPITLYAATMDRGLLKSGDGGANWAPANLKTKTAMALAQDPNAPYIVYVGTESGLYRTDHDGTGWEGVGLNKSIMAVAISRAKSLRLIAVDADGRVYRSDDRGKSWRK